MTEKEDELEFLKSKLSYIKNIFNFERDLDTVKRILCMVFSEDYTNEYKHDYLFNDLSTEEFSKFLSENIEGLEFKVESKTTYLARLSI